MTMGRLVRRGIPAALFLSAAACAFAPCAAGAEEEAAVRVEELDTDKDGRVDEWRHTEGNQVVRVERDRDGDGRREVQIFLEAGKVARSEVDRNNDGQPDLIRFFKEGRAEREQADLNFDGKLDAWAYFSAEGFKDFMIMDKNRDGRPDAWFYYGQAGTKLTGGRVDEDFDGKADRSFGAVPESETRQPWGP